MRIVTRALPKHSRKQTNFRALDYADVPSFMKALPDVLPPNHCQSELESFDEEDDR